MRPIRFSRHAKQRIRLYRIPESVIAEIINEKDFPAGHYELVKNAEGFSLPIKTVFEVADDSVTVITAYPLKRKKI